MEGKRGKLFCGTLILLADDVAKDDAEERGIGRLVFGEGKVVNSGGDGGE